MTSFNACSAFNRCCSRAFAAARARARRALRCFEAAAEYTGFFRAADLAAVPVDFCGAASAAGAPGTKAPRSRSANRRAKETGRIRRTCPPERHGWLGIQPSLCNLERQQCSNSWPSWQPQLHLDREIFALISRFRGNFHRTAESVFKTHATVSEARE